MLQCAEDGSWSQKWEKPDVERGYLYTMLPELLYFI